MAWNELFVKKQSTQQNACSQRSKSLDFHFSTPIPQVTKTASSSEQNADCPTTGEQEEGKKEITFCSPRSGNSKEVRFLWR